MCHDSRIPLENYPVIRGTIPFGHRYDRQDRGTTENQNEIKIIGLKIIGPK